MLSKSQQTLFWRTFSSSCRAQGLNSAPEREEYRKRIMAQECAVAHLADLSPCRDFERIMLRLCLDADDYEGASHWHIAGDRRAAHLVEICAYQLMLLQGTANADAIAYVVGIIEQAKIPARFDSSVWWLDLAAAQLFTVFQMLDTHRRRMLKAAGFTGSLKFDASVQYSRSASGSVRVIAAAPPRAALPIRVA